MTPHHPGRLTVTAALLMTVSVAGCASRGAAPRPFPGAPTPPTTRSQPEPVLPAEPASIASDVVATALALKGTQYRNGGSEPTGGFDCSGLVRASGGVGAPGKGRGTAPRLAQAAVATAMVTATSTASPGQPRTLMTIIVTA